MGQKSTKHDNTGVNSSTTKGGANTGGTEERTGRNEVIESIVARVSNNYELTSRMRFTQHFR